MASKYDSDSPDNDSASDHDTGELRPTINLGGSRNNHTDEDHQVGSDFGGYAYSDDDGEENGAGHDDMLKKLMKNSKYTAGDNKFRWAAQRTGVGREVTELALSKDKKSKVFLDIIWCHLFSNYWLYNFVVKTV